MSFRAIVLGAAAGGGLPQWNCGCQNCELARRGQIPSLTQSSLAVSADGVRWALLNASPDLRQQIAATPKLWPQGRRDSPVDAVLLTNGDIDHVAGLLSLREQQAFTLAATPEIQAVLAANPIFRALDPDRVNRKQVRLGEPFALLPGMTAELFAVPGKVPLYLEEGEVQSDLEGEQTVGVALDCNGARVAYVPGCAAVTPALTEWLEGAALVFFDGTLWRDDEMVLAGLSQKTGRRMGHISMSGPGGSMAALASVSIEHRVFIHMNNTNPVLRPNSAERAEVEAAGWIVASDGMEFTL